MALIVMAPVVMSCAPRIPRHLVLITMDTVRADHLSIYGYHRLTTPRLSEYAKNGSIFTNAYSHSTLTNPSHASMFTSLYPDQHGSIFNKHRLGEERLTLAEILRQNGFLTAAFTSGYPLNAKVSGLRQGFDIYDDRLSKEEPGGAGLHRFRRPGEATVDRALQWIRGLDTSKRMFLFVHLYDAHGPYLPSPKYMAHFEASAPGEPLKNIPHYQQVTAGTWPPISSLPEFVDRYDAQIRYVDDQIATLLDEIDLEDSIVAILSDHGESLGERIQSWWPLNHGGQVYEEQIRVPLILLTPARSKRQISELVQTVDLLPSLLELLNLAPPLDSRFQGRSLVPLLAGEGWSHSGRLIISSSGTEVGPVPNPEHTLDDKRPTYSIRDQRWKLVVVPGKDDDYIELFDLMNNPLQTKDVSEAHSDIRKKLLQQLRDYLTSTRTPTTFSQTELSIDELEGLRALGYLND